MITQKSMYNMFKQISEKHTFIKSFGYGEIEDIEPFISTNKLYPTLWVSLNQVTMVNGVINREYNIVVADLLLNGRENYLDILNQTEQTCFDIFNILTQNGQLTYEVTSQPILTPFTERFSETLAGHTLNIVVSTDGDTSVTGNCNIQLDGDIEYDPMDGTDENKTK
jgi:hypothetical protein